MTDVVPSNRILRPHNHTVRRSFLNLAGPAVEDFVDISSQPLLRFLHGAFSSMRDDTGYSPLLRQALPFLLSQFFKLSEEVCADVAP